MIRVLHSVSNMDRAGIETMLMNYYRRIDRDVLQFDFLANKPKPGDYDEEIRSMGGHIYVSPGLNPIRYPGYIKYVRQILAADRDIAIVHAHNEAMGYYALRGAERAGIKTRIAHAHNTRIIRDYKWPLKMVCKLLLPHAASDLWACGRDAGIYFFGRQRWNAGGMVMRNAIDTACFRFDPEVRAAVRAENGLGDRTVIGHVGRFNMQKNHTRLLDIYAAYMRRDPNSILVLIGEGELEGAMREKARALGIADNVLFAGLQSRVDRWYQAMDVFLLPSLFEGLPVVGIEAQASGLACIFSDAVTDEVVLSPRALRVPLTETDDGWAQALFTLAHGDFSREAGAEVVRDAGYDIVCEAQRIQQLYLEMSRR